jgi:hypothetical protein
MEFCICSKILPSHHLKLRCVQSFLHGVYLIQSIVYDYKVLNLGV